eukprot:scpid76290/ scgid28813/ 
MEYSFHAIAGQNLTLEEREAYRPDIRKFDHGICYSSIALRPWKPFSVQISRVTKKWRGGLVLGVMGCSPEPLQLARQPYACLPYGLEEILERKDVPYFFLTGITQSALGLKKSKEQACTVQFPDGVKPAGLNDTLELVMTDDKTVYCLLNGSLLSSLGQFGADITDVHVVMDIASATVGLRQELPRSLSERCRTAIRQTLNSPTLESVDQLPLPSMMTSYLKFIPRGKAGSPTPI